MTSFIECESFSVSYNIMGIANVTYTIITNSSSPSISDSIVAGGVDFQGIITSVYSQPISNTENANDGPWYSVNVAMVATGE